MVYKIMTFTRIGYSLAKQIMEYAKQHATEDSYSCYSPKQEVVQEGAYPLGGTLQQWCQTAFEEAGGILFIGACGIAVRTIAPFVADKMSDPAVVVMDERGQFAIPILSGHIGGANEWSQVLASWTNGTAVITTASDVEHKIAIDVFAKRNGLLIAEKEMAKAVASYIVSGEAVAFCTDLMIEGKKAEEFQYYTLKEWGNTSTRCEKACVWISEHKPIDSGIPTLHLIPQTICVGIGCRKGKEQAVIEEKMLQALEAYRIDLQSVGAIASIDLKKDEPGLTGVCKKYRIKLVTFSAEVLAQTKGEFTGSSFVKATTGIDNVCERAAMQGAIGISETGKEKAALVCKKQAGDGVTIAIARIDRRLRFE